MWRAAHLQEPNMQRKQLPLFNASSTEVSLWRYKESRLLHMESPCRATTNQEVAAAITMAFK